MLSYQELKAMTQKELQKELSDAREEMMVKRITIKTKHHKDSSSAGKQKRYIAQISTALNELLLEEKVELSNKID